MDDNKDGQVTMKEIKEVIKDEFEEKTDQDCDESEKCKFELQKAKFIFKMFDKNKSGKLDKKEWFGAF